MIELEKHIETLLLWNDCVIVPGFGGFTASHVPARFDEADRLFLPPLRTLGFNQKLNINDSLLAQSYTETYDISYPEALKRIEDEANELKQRIVNEGSYTLNDIGRLYMTESGSIGFTPCEAGVLTPSLYSLSSFEMRKLNDNATLTTQNEEAQAPTPPATATIAVETTPSKQDTAEIEEDAVDDEEEEKSIRIRLSVLRNMAATLIALIGFFLLSTPVNNSTSTAQMGRMEYNTVARLFNGNTKTVKSLPKTADIAKPNNSESDKETQKPTATVGQTKTETQDSYFCLVLASRVSRSNAAAYSKELASKGYNEACVLTEKGHATKVVYGHYTTQNEAYNMLNKLRGNSVFNEAWVYQVKH